MTAEPPKKPDSPYKLNSGRVVLLVLGALALIYTASALLGGLGNYQQLKEGAQEQKAAPAAPTN
jgi:hypothetical protein